MKLLAITLLAAFLAVPALPSFAAGEAAAEHGKPEAVAAAVVKVSKPDLVKGEASYGAICASCHGVDGNSGTPAYPKLSQ